jgi:GDPmannose 4,6-dehydratase
LEEAFHVVDVEIESNGENGPGEQYIRKDNGTTVVRISEDFYRPVELITLQGSNSKAKEKLGWEPKVKFKDLVRIMVENEKSRFEMP